jgi:hypothetical protein
VWSYSIRRHAQKKRQYFEHGRGDGHLATLEEALFSGSLESGLFLGNLISYSPFLYAGWLSGFILLFLQIR